MNIFSMSELEKKSEQIIPDLIRKSFIILEISSEQNNVFHREDIIQQIFELSSEIKTSCGEFGVVNGYSLGYRAEGEREFLETRLNTARKVEPSLLIEGYQESIQDIFTELQKICSLILDGISSYLHIDPNFLRELIDSNEGDIQGRYSSGLLRICSYPPHNISTNNDDVNDDNNIAFGAHTDTSFLTIAPVSSIPGLEVFDYSTHTWLSPELNLTHNHVIVLVGEFLQILFKQIFRACVHRVRCHKMGIRYSCPLLMRGRFLSKLDVNNTLKYHHGEDVDIQSLPSDLDGISMKEIHTLLDLKRKKCARENQKAGEIEDKGWVLAAFPCPDVLR